LDEPHHFTNDPDGKFASARAARAKLAELDQHAEQQLTLPDLRAARAAVIAEKQEVATAIAAFGAAGHVETNPDRQRLVERLQALNLSLNDLNRRIDAIPVMAACDRAALREDLERRAAKGG
jgi:hypothetical protein